MALARVWATWSTLMTYGTLSIAAGLISIGVTRADNLRDIEDSAHYNAETIRDERCHTASAEDGICHAMDNAFNPGDLDIPAYYESWNAGSKQEHLWVNGALRTQYKEGQLPALQKIDVLGLISSSLWTKVRNHIDVAPPGYGKPIHAYGMLAKVRFIPMADSPYTGLFQGSDHGLLRLSVTGDPADRGFAPGLAWKLFVDGHPSENVSALYRLTGQGSNYNFFANELSQYVMPELNASLVTSAIFSAVTAKPTLLMLNDMAEVRQDGTKVAQPLSPTQIYFVPNQEIANLFSTAAHDFREDLAMLQEGLKLYDLYATDVEIKTSLLPSRSRRYAEERRKEARKIGEIVLSSPFIASEFGDSGIFFKHQRYEDR